MLLEFHLGNYRSFRDEQALSMVASSDKEHKETHLIPTGIKTIPSALSTAAIYGPNAGGKSNIVLALSYFTAMVRESATKVKPGQELNVKPFLLDNKYSEAPSEFEMTFILDGVRYQYGFATTKHKVHREWLLVYKSHRPQQWFNRYIDQDTKEYIYEFSTFLTGEKKQTEKLTRDNALFLSVAAQLNNPQLTPIFDYLAKDLVFFLGDQQHMKDYSVRLLKDDKARREITKFLQSADIAIKDIQVEEFRGKTMVLQVNMETGIQDTKAEEADMLTPKFIHETEHGSAVFDLADESLGTQRLFALAGPILNILERGLVFIVDEIDSSLHPLLIKHLIGLFNDPKKNPNGAQLILTTHDTSLLDNMIFRRDQIWFVEKNRDQASELYLACQCCKISK